MAETTENTIQIEPAVQELPRPKYQWLTDCPQDWFILVVRGGDLHRIIHSVEGWYVDENFEFQPENAEHENSVTVLRALTGFEFIGIPGIQGMKVTKFAWNKYWREESTSPTYIVKTHDPELVHIYPFEAQYPLTFQGIETIAQDRTEDKAESFVAVTFVVTVRVRMLRPRIALQTNIDWFGSTLVPKMQSALKDFAGNKNYDELIRGARRRVTAELIGFIMGKKNERSPFRKVILDYAGVDIIDFSLVDIQPNPAFEAAQNRLAEKQKEAQGIIALAEAEKQARILKGEGDKQYETLVGQGKASAVKAIRESAGPDSETFLKWDLVRQAGLNTYVGDAGRASIIVGTDGKPIR